MANKKQETTEELQTDDKTTLVQGGTFSQRLGDAAEIPPSLVMLVGPAGFVGRQWPIDGEDIVVGRSMTSAIFVDDKSVSKSHTKLTVSNGEVHLIDLESTNKTVVNGDPVAPFAPIKLNNNDQIKIGNVLFKFLEEGSLEAVANQTLQQKSEKDPLTNIWNKGALLQKGPESFKRARLLEVPLSLLVFDIDFFKKVNDNYSHSAGDFVLSEISKVVSQELIRGDDFFARFGGEEFVIILFGSTIDQADEIGERVRAKIENHKFEFEGKTLPITISVGVSQQDENMKSWDELFARADAALYQSKNNGRNQVTVL